MSAEYLDLLEEVENGVDYSEVEGINLDDIVLDDIVLEEFIPSPEQVEFDEWYKRLSSVKDYSSKVDVFKEKFKLSDYGTKSSPVVFIRSDNYSVGFDSRREFVQFTKDLSAVYEFAFKGSFPLGLISKYKACLA